MNPPPISLRETTDTLLGKIGLPSIEWPGPIAIPCSLNERFHELIAREQSGEATQDETLELDCLCRLMEAAQ